MTDLLFNPNGRILPRRFWQGLIILTVASVITTAAVYVVGQESVAAGVISLLNFALIFPYICVFGKRLHDAGKSAWLVIPIWIGGFVLQMIMMSIFLFAVLPNFMTPDQQDTLEQVFKLAEAGDTAEMILGIEYMMEQHQSTFQRLAIAMTVIANGAMGWLVASFKSDPMENQFGPAPYDASRGSFD